MMIPVLWHVMLIPPHYMKFLKKIYSDILLYYTESDALSLFSGVFFLHSTCCNMYMWYCKRRGKQRIITSFNLQTWGDTSTCNLADVTTPQKVTTNICANVLIFKRLAYTYANRLLLWRNRMLHQSATYGTKYRVRQIVHKTNRTDINSRTLQAVVIV